MLEAEVEEFLLNHAQLADDTGKPRVVRNGYLPERKVKTALGKVPVKIPRVRDRAKVAGLERIRFNSKIISPYQRRTNARGHFINRFLTELSRGDVVEAAAVLLGSKRQMVTPAIVNKLKDAYQTGTGAKAKFEDKHFRYVWVDCIREEAEIPSAASPLIVAIGETDWGEKDLLLIMEQQSSGLNLYRMLIDKLSELGVSGQPFVALSNQCWAN
jgi:transposase-like protein